MPTITDLYQIHLRHLDLTLAESDLLLQREGGLDGELKTSGSICEQFIRRTLAKYAVPGHFRLTSGFIATPGLLAQRSNLPQCDVLVADNSAPPLLRLAETEIEVLPLESVMALIEAKRTLTKRSLSDALDQLKKVIDSVDPSGNLKTDRELNRVNKYAGFHNHSSNKPLVGVIAMTCDIPNFTEEVARVIVDKNSLVDFVWTLDGYALFPAFQTETGQVLIYTHTARPETGSSRNSV